MPRLLLPAFLTVLLSYPLGALAADAVGKPDSQPRIQSGQPHGAAMQGQFLGQLKQQLSLSDEQVKAIEKIQNEARQESIANRAPSQADDFRAMMGIAPDSPEFDAAAKKAGDEAAARAQARVKAFAENRKKVYAVLNDEQKKKFLALRVGVQKRQASPAPAKK